MIAEAFIPNPENKPYVNHIDGDKHNNNVTNLEWVTPKENSKHAFETGLIGSGANSHKAELTSFQVHAICKMLMQGYRVKDIKEKFNISQSVVSSIKNKTRYKEISRLYEFPKKSRCLSIETVRWICSMIELGKTNREISASYTGNKLYKGAIDMIRSKRAYVDISKDFNF